MNWFSLLMPSQSEFDNTVQDILNDTEYKHLKNSLRDFYENTKERISEWFYDMLSKSFSGIPDPSELSGKLSTVFMIIGIVIITAIIIIIVIKVSKTLERKGRVKEILGEKIDDSATPNSLRLKASAFEKEGDYRTAIRYDFISLLLLMHEKNMVYLDETKTNGEIYEYLKKNGFIDINTFRYISDTFNSTWYGHKRSDDSIYKIWSDYIDLLWNEVISYEEKH